MGRVLVIALVVLPIMALIELNRRIYGDGPSGRTVQVLSWIGQAGMVVLAVRALLN